MRNRIAFLQSVASRHCRPALRATIGEAVIDPAPEVPDTMKPRKIEISAAAYTPIGLPSVA
jgi:hypothetical protein